MRPHLIIQRDDVQPWPDRTLGRATLYDAAGGILWQGHTLELPWVDTDGDGLRDRRVSRIPAGRYRAVPHGWREVRRFRRVWRLLRVPSATAILLHAGKWVRHTEGCILMGEARQDFDRDGRPEIARSREAINALRHHIGERELDITVIDGVATDPNAPSPWAHLLTPFTPTTPYPPSLNP